MRQLASRSSSPSTTGALLQRKCGCGTHTGGGQCAGCSRAGTASEAAGPTARTTDTERAVERRPFRN